MKKIFAATSALLACITILLAAPPPPFAYTPFSTNKGPGIKIPGFTLEGGTFAGKAVLTNSSSTNTILGGSTVATGPVNLGDPALGNGITNNGPVWNANPVFFNDSVQFISGAVIKNGSLHGSLSGSSNLTQSGVSGLPASLSYFSNNVGSGGGGATNLVSGLTVTLHTNAGIISFEVESNLFTQLTNAYALSTNLDASKIQISLSNVYGGVWSTGIVSSPNFTGNGAGLTNVISSNVSLNIANTNVLILSGFGADFITMSNFYNGGVGFTTNLSAANGYYFWSNSTAAYVGTNGFGVMDLDDGKWITNAVSGYDGVNATALAYGAYFAGTWLQGDVANTPYAGALSTFPSNMVALVFGGDVPYSIGTNVPLNYYGSWKSSLLNNYTNELKIVTPEAFGALGDGAHDDTAAVQAAVAAAETMHGMVWLAPKAHYFIGSPPIFLRAQRMLIKGLECAQTVNTNCNVRFIAGTNCFELVNSGDGLVIEGVAIRGPGATVAGSVGFRLGSSGTLLTDGQQVALRDCHVSLCDKAIVEQAMDNLELTRIAVFSCSNALVALSGGVQQAMRIVSLQCFNAYGTTVDLQGGEDFQFWGCDLYRETYPGAHVKVGTGVRCLFSGNMEGGAPNFYVDGGSLEVNIVNADHSTFGTTNGNIVLTNNANLTVRSSALLYKDTKGFVVKSHNTTLSPNIISEQPLLVTNAYLNLAYWVGPAGGLRGTNIPPESAAYPGQSFEWNSNGNTFYLHSTIYSNTWTSTNGPY